MKHPNILLCAALLLGLLSACGGGAGTAPSATPTVPSATQTVEMEEAVFGTFVTQDLEGNEVDDSIFAGHELTMVNIWATFCGPCLDEMPDLGELNSAYADQGFQVVGIVIDVLNQDGTYHEGQLELAREAVTLTGADYTHLLPSADLILSRLQSVTAVPETIFVDSQGNQVGESYLGAKDKEAWEEIIQSLLEEVA